MPSLQTTFDRAPRFILLLLLILAELVLAPFFVASEYGLRAAQLLSGLFMMATLWAVGAQRTSVTLFVATLAAHLLAVYSGDFAPRAMGLLLRVAFYGYATGLIIWRTLRQPDVTLDTIAGAACAYALLGLVWGNGYVLLESFRPGSFQIPAVWQLGAAGDSTTALVYFSYVTLTTVGYGDITPLWPGAAGLAVAEAIVGQLYLAITIARLVGLHTSRRG